MLHRCFYYRVYEDQYFEYSHSLSHDLLIIDKSIEPVNGKIAVCFIEGEFTVKRLKIEKGELFLMPENKRYKPIKVEENDELIIWGIVTYVIKSL